MWVLVDILGVVIAFTIVMVLRAGWRFPADQVAHGCDVSLYGSPPNLRGMSLDAPTSAGVEFEIRSERWFDRYAKRKRLSIEGEVGEPRFDHKLYLLSDDPYVLEGLRFDPELRAALLRLFDLQSPYGVQVKRVVCRDRSVRVELATGASYHSAQAIIAHAAGLLLPVARRLDAASADRRPDRFRGRADQLLALAGALFINGCVHFVRQGNWEVLEMGRGLLLAEIFAALLVIALAIGTWRALGGTSRMHLVLPKVLLMGSVGALLTAIAVVRDLGL